MFCGFFLFYSFKSFGFCSKRKGHKLLLLQIPSKLPIVTYNPILPRYNKLPVLLENCFELHFYRAHMHYYHYYHNHSSYCEYGAASLWITFFSLSDSFFVRTKTRHVVQAKLTSDPWGSQHFTGINISLCDGREIHSDLPE